MPGPAELGRGVVVSGQPPPAPWREVPTVTIDEAVLADPARAVAALHQRWAARQPVIVDLRVDPARFRDPPSIDIEPWRLAAEAEPTFDRLHFLVWANHYDARAGGDPVWWWAVKAARLQAGAAVGGPADVILADGRPVWIDDGPRRPWDVLDGAVVIHAETIDDGSLHEVPAPAEPRASLAPDQLAAVGHLQGPARVIAPAGSGKTRVLTERLRHLHRDRAYEPGAVLAVAYNKQAQLELEARTTDFRPRVRTLNSLGLWVLAEHRGAPPALVEEREVRRIVESLIPGRRPRRANTDPIGPYVEGLSAIRLGLRDPDVVEASRDDVPGLGALFPAFREHLAGRGAVDFDDQIYAAVQALLADGPFRRALQRSCRHLLVDEFQDLTPAHVLLLRLLALPSLDVFGVGDDDQTIYGHAGADPRFLIEYGRLFPGAAEHALTVNYRCPVEVVDGARTLLGYNHRRVPKRIDAGPDNDAAQGALHVVHHAADGAAGALIDQVRAWLAEPQAATSSIAVLARVNSLLLAPHVALDDAGIALSSVLGREVLERTGVRAALAYLRIAAADGRPAAADVVEILRRPTRGLPQWFPERLARRMTWSLDHLGRLADQVPDKEAAKVLRLVADLAVVVEAGRDGSTRQVLEAVRDDVGLGAAMNLLDRTGGGQGSSHLDDLEGLLGVADLHPDPGGFEAWLRRSFQRQRDPHGVTLATIHRVKGREWDRVLVFGATEGIVPHRLAEDVEEERRVLHVGITRGRHRVAVLADRTRPSPFLAELAGTAPRTAPRPERVPPPVVTPNRAVPTGIEADHDRVVIAPGGLEGRVEDVDGAGATIRLTSGATMRVRFGERVVHEGRRAALVPPERLWGRAAEAEAALREWRARRCRADGVPAYVVVHDRHLRTIAMARPRTPTELIACDGIGPAKLERYGEDILAVLEPFLANA
jgi:DNA helicase-2/ATP-dependent DNA helicase PcrA